jgi:GNAT superfamily N-acetyltransferase
MNLQLRTIGARAEAEGVQALLEQAVRAVLGPDASRLGVNDAAAIARRTLTRLGSAREALLVVAQPHEVARPLALAASAPLEDPLTGDARALLVLLYTDPSIRQRGVARALVGELRRALSQRGVGELWARAAHNDDALISMGERWGFVRAWELMIVE